MEADLLAIVIEAAAREGYSEMRNHIAELGVSLASWEKLNFQHQVIWQRIAKKMVVCLLSRIGSETSSPDLIPKAIEPHAPQRLSVWEAALHTGLSQSFLNKLRVSGGGPKYLKLGRRVVYDKSDLDEWFKRNRTSSTSNGVSRETPRGTEA